MDFRAYYTDVVAELRKIDDIRLHVLFLHLNIEYLIDKIIEKYFKNSKVIFENEHLKSFMSKVRLLDSLGFFEDRKTLYNRIILVNKIRNDFAHGIIKKDTIPKKTMDRFFTLGDISLDKKMRDILSKDNKPAYPQITFFVASFSIIFLLSEMYKAMNVPKDPLFDNHKIIFPDKF
ncbi:MAG: hypothetical protein V1866_04175 [archaeon]